MIRRVRSAFGSGYNTYVHGSAGGPEGDWAERRAVRRVAGWLAGWPKTVRCRLRLPPVVLLLFRRLLAEIARARVCDSVLRRGGVWCGLGARSAAIYTPRETRPVLLSNPSAAPLRRRRPCRPVAARSPCRPVAAARRAAYAPLAQRTRQDRRRTRRDLRQIGPIDDPARRVIVRSTKSPSKTWRARSRSDNDRNTWCGQCREIALIYWFFLILN